MERAIAKITIPFYRIYWRVFRPQTTRVRIILLCEENVLFIKNIGKSSWSLPGGQVEEGESLYIALKRELKEELNIKSCDIKFLLGQYKQVSSSRRDTVYVFVGQLKQRPLLKLQWEIEEARWFGLSSIPPSANIEVKNRIKELLSGKKNIYSNW